MDEIVKLLASHPEFSSWLMSDSYGRGMTRGDLRKAFPSLRFRPEGEAIVRLYRKDPTALRRAASLASGFSSGADAARLTGLRSLLPRLAGAGRIFSGFGGLATALLGGEAMEALAEDREARDRIREMDRNRAVARSLDRELRRADRMGDRERQLIEDARARQARLRREIDSSVYTAEPPLPVPDPRRPATVGDTGVMGPSTPLQSVQATPRDPWMIQRGSEQMYRPYDLDEIRVVGPSSTPGGRGAHMEASEAVQGQRPPVVQAAPAPEATPSSILAERMRELMPTTLVEKTRRADMGVPVQDIVMAELRREPETRRQWVKSDIPGVMGTWQDLPYELQPATTLSEREIRRMIEESR